MAKAIRTPARDLERLRKSPTGIQGFDEITGGGLPQDRIALITGGPGSGKTLFSMEFIVRGAVQFNEPGLFVSFEETAEELEKNVASLGFDLRDLEAKKKLIVDHIPIERSEIEETGDYDLEGLFVRLGALIDSIGAKRVALDTLEALFSGFPNELILRAELRRLFRWLKGKGVTTIVTAETGTKSLTRHGIEEYVSDCVIVLSHIIRESAATRRLRVVKYRGSHHGTNEYPFLIGNTGISVLPITSLELNYAVSSKRVTTGIPRLDAMFGGKGFFKGSSILVSGTAGTGKSTMAATFADNACRNGQKVLYLAFEESKDQIIRNMQSVGLDLEPWVKKGLLKFHNVRPTLYGLEMHLVAIHDLVSQLEPDVVIFDPISNLISVGDALEVKSMLTRLIDYLKLKQITALLTNLLLDPNKLESTEIGVSSLMDVYIVLRDVECNGERNRAIHIVKSRGMDHSNQLQEFLITSKGIQLRPAYVGKGTVLTGSARALQEAQDKADEERQKMEALRKLKTSERNRKALEAQIAALQAQLEGESEESHRIREEEHLSEKQATLVQQQISKLRNAGPEEQTPNGVAKKPGRR